MMTKGSHVLRVVFTVMDPSTCEDELQLWTMKYSTSGYSLSRHALARFARQNLPLGRQCQGH